MRNDEGRVGHPSADFSCPHHTVGALLFPENPRALCGCEGKGGIKITVRAERTAHLSCNLPTTLHYVQLLWNDPVFYAWWGGQPRSPLQDGSEGSKGGGGTGGKGKKSFADLVRQAVLDCAKKLFNVTMTSFTQTEPGRLADSPEQLPMAERSTSRMML